MSDSDSLEIDIRPEVNILSVLRHLNYKPWFAMAEFVDNSLGSYLAMPSHGESTPDKLRVQIDTSGAGEGRILITDNAAGIKAEDFPRAFRAAQVPPDRSGLSEFGMGMKSAASWFARKWSVRTTVAGEAVQRSISFDLADITDNHLDHLSVRESWCEPSAHFTVVELTDLNRVPQTATVSKIRSHLASIYRAFVRDGRMELTFNGEILSFDAVDVLVAPAAGELDGPVSRWQKEIHLELSGGRRVDGFAAIRAVGSTSQAGFALLRRGRLIMGSHDDSYRPTEIFGRSNSYTYQRLFGELTLDGFEVSHTKDGFRWEEQEEEFLEELLIALRAEPKNLLLQAATYRAKNAIDLIKPIEAAASNVAGAVESHFESMLEAVLADEALETAIPDDAVVASSKSIRRMARLNVDARIWIIDIEATLDASVQDWLSVGATVDDSLDDNGRPCSRVDVSVSLAHPFSQKFLGANNENSELIIAFASALALSLALGKLSGSKSFRILQHMNTLARETFSIVASSEESKS